MSKEFNNAEHNADIACAICSSGGKVSEEAYELTKKVASGDIDIDEAIRTIKEIYGLKV